jgi:hypothetical protein
MGGAVRHKKIQFDGATAGARQGAARRSPVRSVFFAALPLTLGAVGVSGYVASDVRDSGDGDPRENPPGFELAGTALPQDRAPRAIKGAATPFFGTTWIELSATLTGAVAPLAGAWFCLRHAVETALTETILSLLAQSRRRTSP